MSVSRGRYESTEGAQRVIDLFSRYEILGTCFMTGVTVEWFPDMCKMIQDAGLEVGHHGYLHTKPNTLTLEQECEDLVKGLEVFDRVLKVKPLGYRAPWLFASENTY